MFRAMISTISRNTRLCVTACGLMHPRCCRPVAWKPPLPGNRPATPWVHYTTSCNTQSSSSEDGRNHRPKQVQLIGIINKLLLLHLVGCVCYLQNLKSALSHIHEVWPEIPLSSLRADTVIVSFVAQRSYLYVNRSVRFEAQQFWFMWSFKI